MPPPTRPTLLIRLYHTGQYADGRANSSSVLVNDLDVGYEHQDRKVAVYVPPGGSIDINASSRSMLSFEQGVIKKFTQVGVLQSKMFYVPEPYTTAGLPPATQYPAGTFVWDTTLKTPTWSDGTNWVSGSAAPSGPAGGDLSGTYPNPTVVGLEGFPIEPPPPVNGDVLVFNGVFNRWDHTSLTFGGGPPSGPAGGDLNGLYPNPVVDGLQNRPVAATAPATGNALMWTGAQWEPGNPTGGTGTMGYALNPIQAITLPTNQLTPVGTYHRFTSAGSINLTSTPTINWAGAVAGQLLVLHNVGAPGTGHLTLDRGVGSALALSNANQRIDEGGTMTLIYDGSKWIEISHTQATST